MGFAAESAEGWRGNAGGKRGLATSPHMDALRVFSPVLAARDLTGYLTVLGVMILVLVVAGAGLMVLRARMLRKSDPAGQQAGLMQNLRAMRDRGEISIEEFEAARNAMVARAAGREVPRPTAQKAAEPMPEIPAPGELRAKPGFDLTGRPLPKSGSSDEGS